MSTAECATDRALLREVIQENNFVEVENVQGKADFYFLHPMMEGDSK